MASWAREGIVLLCSELEQPHLEGWGQFWVPQCMKDTKVREHPEVSYEEGEGSGGEVV